MATPDPNKRNAAPTSLQIVDARMREAPAPPTPVEAEAPYAKRPGVLRGVSTLTIKTHLAQQFVFGRGGGRYSDNDHHIMGLIGFARTVKGVFRGAKQDDPYADQCLLSIEATIDAAVKEIAGSRDIVVEALAQRPDVQHEVAQSVQPLQVPLYFSNPFAFRAAYLINDFDTLVCAIQTAKHVAVITTIEGRAMMQRSSKTVRGMFNSANEYRFTGVSRADIAHGTAKAREAIERWGELPADILDGTRRAEYGPPLPSGSFARRIADDAGGSEDAEC